MAGKFLSVFFVFILFSCVFFGCNDTTTSFGESDGDTENTDGDSIIVDGDDTVADGDNVKPDGDDSVADGDNVKPDGDDSVADGDEDVVIAESNLVINEVVAKSTDANGETQPDWIELFNIGEALDIGGYSLKDENDEGVMEFAAGTTIGSGEYLVVEKDDLGENGFAFGLGSSDSVRLYNAAEELIDTTSWNDGDASANTSWGRIPNGEGEFKTLYTITQDAENVDNTGDIPASGLCPDDDEDTVRPENWEKLSHCKGVDPDYDQLFDDTVVNRIDIIVSASDYEDTMDDLESIYGNTHPMKSTDEDIIVNAPPDGPPDDPNQSSSDPMWVPVTVKYNNATWEYVGMRYKGNSSLRSAYQSGVKKLSFRLNFDKYEDDHPAYADQRFFGFKKMTFSNGYNDNSLMRDKLAADIFRAGGVPAARGSFVRIYVDFGQGSTYFGLYTMIEDPSDEMLDQQFEDGSGNLYKPDGTGAAFGTFDESSFEKKTNEDDSDWSDVKAVFSALHANTSGEEWRTGLEAVFDVAAFLKCLAYNQAMVNWDSYGIMTHNYYIYANPANDGKITWFPWDLNESLKVGGMSSSIAESVMLDQVGNSWPMIRYLLDDSTYRTQYQSHLASALETGFELNSVNAMIDEYHALIAPYVTGSEPEKSPYTFLRSSSDFSNSVSNASDALKPHVAERHTVVKNELGL